MAEEKPITIPALIAAMKEAGFATRVDVEEIVTKKVLEATDAILDGQTPIYERLDAIEAKQREHDKRFEKLETGQARLEVAQAHTTDQIKGLKSDLSDTPSRAEHNSLKERMTVLENRH